METKLADTTAQAQTGTLMTTGLPRETTTLIQAQLELATPPLAIAHLLVDMEAVAATEPIQAMELGGNNPANRKLKIGGQLTPYFFTKSP
jgi:hypothetical protein